MGKSTNLQELRDLIRERTRSDFSRYLYALTLEEYGLIGRAEIAHAFTEYLQSLAEQANI